MKMAGQLPSHLQWARYLSPLHMQEQMDTLEGLNGQRLKRLDVSILENFMELIAIEPVERNCVPECRCHECANDRDNGIGYISPNVSMNGNDAPIEDALEQDQVEEDFVMANEIFDYYR